MEAHRLALSALPHAGDITSFYAYEGGAARSMVLLQCAQLLAARANGTLPVLLVDADTRAPGLHQLLGCRDERPGLLEWLTHCHELIRARRRHGHQDDAALARQVLDVSDWRQYVDRVDEGSSLYLLRAGRLDDSFHARAAALDWAGLFQACPPLLQLWAEELCSVFGHVLLDLPLGRADGLAVLQAVLPRKCVALFTPNRRSLQGLAAMVERTKSFRIFNEDFAQPFVLYPLPLAAAPQDRARFQPELEQLMERIYGWSGISLDSWFDEVSLPPSALLASDDPRQPGDPLLRRALQQLLAWHAGDHMAWDAFAEVQLVRAVRQARAVPGTGPEAGLPLAAALEALGAYYWRRADELQALPCLSEATALRARHLGETHAQTLAVRLQLAAAQRAHGRLAEARRAFEQVLGAYTGSLGVDHAETLAARAGLAQTLADLGDWTAALALHEQVLGAHERLDGPEHVRTLAVLAEHAGLRARHGELGRARMLYERLLEGRQRVLGSEHRDTLDSTLALAAVLARCDEPVMARQLREQVLDICLRRDGPQAPSTRIARAALAASARPAPGADEAVICVAEQLVPASNGILELEAGQGVAAPAGLDPLPRERLASTAPLTDS
ncbi:tetratricopeptide repeat protein [Massilia sp. TS11]|uniref:tetratricopeptide repeat protein n=1 Tax=Massilia sp. TS11 TaxID=2908003 RepID=UPI001EDC2651|nr:tetratricopeptide repeat protein [Massilia sp. TS11]MCG2583124.1 tetratricopeptide repeat protein [Massilia sp. TS11]